MLSECFSGGSPLEYIFCSCIISLLHGKLNILDLYKKPSYTLSMTVVPFCTEKGTLLKDAL